MSNAVNSKNVGVFANAYDISNYLRNFQGERAAEELDSTTFQDTARSYVAGFEEGTLNLDGFYSVDLVNLNTAEEIFKTGIGQSAVVTITPEGFTTLGNRALLQSAVETRHSVESPANGLITTAASFRGPLTHGVLLATKAARTSTAALTGVDELAATAFGGSGHLHIFAKSGTTPSITAKIQHSTDNSAFTDLITFAAATDLTSERVTLGATATVNRYVRAQFTISGTTPSFTFAIAFARNYR